MLDYNPSPGAHLWHTPGTALMGRGEGCKDLVNFAKAMPEMVNGKGCKHCASFVGSEAKGAKT